MSTLPAATVSVSASGDVASRSLSGESCWS